jgi:tetratricopeptide (TPR) repeat protein
MHMRLRGNVIVGVLGIALAGCGANLATKVNTAETQTKPDVVPKVASVSARTRFDQALAAFVAHDKAADWTEATCTEVAAMFDGTKLPEAVFDAGMALQRCKRDAEASEHFQSALSADPQLHDAKVELALYQLKADGNIDAAIARLQQTVVDARYQNVSALVNLATLQVQRAGSSVAAGCADDMDCAKQNLERALAIDDAYMPALNELALYYLAQAKKEKRSNVQQLELALLVASQAMLKNPNYAPIYNTAGLVQNELGKVNLAVQSFAKAAALDPTFFEAQMNHGEVNLSFRGFSAAEGAFRRAVAIRSNDYDAHLGLALALRGQITDANYAHQMAAVQAELSLCKKLDARRPDAYYNEGILTQEYKPKLLGGRVPETITALEEAIVILRDFISKAANKPAYAQTVNKANDRIQDAIAMIEFLRPQRSATTTTTPHQP